MGGDRAEGGDAAAGGERRAGVDGDRGGGADDLSGTVWIDGELFALEAAHLSPFDHGLLVGDGVFETMKVLDGTPFALTRHLRRLARSLTGLGLAPPDERWLRRGIADVLAANGRGVGRLRITLTSGAGPLGSRRGGHDATAVLLTGPPARWPPAAAVTMAPWPRNERSPLAGLKTTSYAENVLALAQATGRGASEAIFANTVGDLCEGTGTNVFVVVAGRLVTPPLRSGCLPGVTRELVLEVLADPAAAGDGPVIDELDVPAGALARSPEAFLTSSTRDVQPIASVDGVELARCPGPLTTLVTGAFAALQARSLDP